ncbi:MAG: thiolase family protein [Pigmentiphaga sp.]
MSTKHYEGVALVCPVTVPYERTSEHGVPWFVGTALRQMLAAAGLSKPEVDGLIVSSYRLTPDSCASMTEYLSLAPRFIADLPYGGASGVLALRRAARAVQAGDAEVVACIGADVVPSSGDIGANFSSFSRDHVFPYGAGGPNGVFALVTQHYNRLYGARAEDYGHICVAQRANASQFPLALLRKPMTLSDYLNARMIAEPLRLFDCVMRCCGAEGFLVLPVERAQRLGLPYVRIAGAVERHNGSYADPVQVAVGVQLDSNELYAQASRAPVDMDFVQLYDDYPVICMLQLESLGFCERGEAASFLQPRTLTTDGDFPVNTSGGMLSMGQAGAAGGFVGVIEALRQLTGAALGGVVANAEIGLVSGYGTVNYDRGICSAAAILERGTPRHTTSLSRERRHADIDSPEAE